VLISGKWLTSAKDGRWKRPYTDLIYQPMLEVMQYLRTNGGARRRALNEMCRLHASY
jgi:hypothetical protein